MTDGGYAEFVTLDFTGVTKVPKELDPAQAPLFCSGVTTFVSCPFPKRRPSLT